MMDFGLSQTQEMIVSTVRDFVELAFVRAPRSGRPAFVVLPRMSH